MCNIQEQFIFASTTYENNLLFTTVEHKASLNPMTRAAKIKQRDLCKPCGGTSNDNLDRYSSDSIGDVGYGY